MQAQQHERAASQERHRRDDPTAAGATFPSLQAGTPSSKTTYHSSEDASKYRRNASFVYNASNTAPVLALLDAQKGQCVLDLGCGSGELTQQIAQLVGPKGRVLGVDVSRDMIASARQSVHQAASASSSALGSAERLAPQTDSAQLSYDLADGCALVGYLQDNNLLGGFDAVFSNAALHWMKRSPADVVAGVHAALKTGGVFAAECGGFMNVAGIRGCCHRILQRHGVDPHSVDPWYFPTPEAYSKLLTSPSLQPGFDVVSCELVPRPTPVPNGISSWLETFCGSFLNVLPSDEARGSAVKEVEDFLRPDYYDESSGTWSIMYVRLRFKAVKRASAVESVGQTPMSTSGAEGVEVRHQDRPLAPKLKPDAASLVAAASLQSKFVNKTVLVHLIAAPVQALSLSKGGDEETQASSSRNSGPAPDQRVFKGTFKCVDNEGNVVLSQTEEWTVRPALLAQEQMRGGDSMGSERTTCTEDRVVSRRFVGMVMIKGTDVGKIEVEQTQTQTQPGNLERRADGPGSMQSAWPMDADAYA